ncbi:MAG: hypothetical protein AB4352_17275 [Hormoscilla sp.]
MQKVFKVLVALVVAAALTWIPSFTSAPALAADVEFHPGLQFTSGYNGFEQFQSGAIFSPGHEVHVYYDALRASSDNNSCPPFGPGTEVTGHVMSDNSGDITEFSLGNLDEGVDFVKVGEFTTPECFQQSGTIQMWFTATGAGCVDSDFGQNYTFPVICQ